ncbi:MAG: ATP-binding cassette domain-containing protein, partial [Endomicrobiia bacterium]
MDNFIETKNLYKSFFVQKEEVKALIDINLTVKYGEILVITGPSGSGKSTLLHLLGLMDTPTKGEIVFENKPISTLT